MAAKDDGKTTKGKKSKREKKREDTESDAPGGDEEHFVFFYGKTSPFSQHHPCEFIVDDITFNCAEQYMMYNKAGKRYYYYSHTRDRSPWTCQEWNFLPIDP